MAARLQISQMSQLLTSLCVYKIVVMVQISQMSQILIRQCPFKVEATNIGKLICEYFDVEKELG